MTDDLQTLIDQVRVMTEGMNRTLSAEQRTVTFGSYWARFYDVRARIVIFGYVDSLAAMEESERRLGADDAEATYIRAETERRHHDGFMYGMCYSTIDPTGEWGFTHRSELWPISEELFEKYRAVGWDVDHPDLPWETKVELAVAYTDYATHVHGIEGEAGVGA